MPKDANPAPIPISEQELQDYPGVTLAPNVLTSTQAVTKQQVACALDRVLAFYPEPRHWEPGA